MKPKLIFLFSLILTFFWGCTATQVTERTATNKSNYEQLLDQIDAYFNDSSFSHAHWGVLVKSLKTGKVWYERNSRRMFMPASNQKILTTASALTKLGPGFRYETDLSYSGMFQDSILRGDLVVWSNGDPTLYSKFYSDPREVFRSWADSLKKIGIRVITGNVIADDNAFDDRPFGNGWPVDDLDAWYSAEIGPLQINEDNLDLNIIPPDSINGKILIEPNLPSSYYTIVNNLKATENGSSDVYMNRAYGTNQIILEGEVKVKSEPFELSPSLHNPTLFYATVLREVLIEKGINVLGNAADCDDIPGWSSASSTLLIKHFSPNLSEIIKGLMKRSQNLYAETLLKTLGWKYSGQGSFRSGRKIIEDVLNNFGIPPKTYAYYDGSGLSRYNYVSPEELVKILTVMYNGENKVPWLESFPIAGVDGTLKNRMKNCRAEGNVQAKTGTIANVRGLSGYVKTADGEHLVFSFLVNGHLKTSEDTNYITDSVLKAIAEYSEVNLAGK